MRRLGEFEQVIDGLRTTITLQQGEINELRKRVILNKYVTAEHTSANSNEVGVGGVASMVSQEEIPSSHLSKSSLAIIHQELNDSNRRKNNVLVTGLVPVDGTSDKELFTNLCEEHLNLKPFVEESRCKRVGKQADGKIQPLLITLTSEETVNDVIAASRALRNCQCHPSHKSIYVNKDLTPAAAYAAYLDRERRRRSRDKQAQAHPQPAASQSAASQSADTPLMPPLDYMVSDAPPLPPCSTVLHSAQHSSSAQLNQVNAQEHYLQANSNLISLTTYSSPMSAPTYTAGFPNVAAPTFVAYTCPQSCVSSTQAAVHPDALTQLPFHNTPSGQITFRAS